MRLSPTHNSLVCPPLLLVKSCKISVNVEEFSSVTRADVTLKNLLQFSSTRFARFPRFNELSSSSDFFSFSEELELEHKLESFLSVELLFLLSSDSRLSEFSLFQIRVTLVFKYSYQHAFSSKLAEHVSDLGSLLQLHFLHLQMVPGLLPLRLN